MDKESHIIFKTSPIFLKHILLNPYVYIEKTYEQKIIPTCSFLDIVDAG